MVRERPLKLRNETIPAAEQGSTGLYILAGTAFATWFVQFFTGIFETWPLLGTGTAGAEAIVVAAIALGGLREPRPARRALTIAAGVAVAGAALWGMQTKLSYSGTMVSHPRYSAPHVRMPDAAGAREVRLTCADGTGIDGVYLAGRQSVGLVVYPSWISGKNGLAVASLARWLAPTFQVLVLDPRGSGGSGGFQRGAGDGKQDILAGAAFLRDKGATRIGVLAEGDGSVAAALAVAEDPGLHALLLTGPAASWGEPRKGDAWWDDPRTSVGRIYWRVAAGARLTQANGPSLAEVLPKVAPRPLLIVANAGDGAKEAQQLFLAASEPRGLRLLPGAGRPLDWASYPAYFSAARDWFRQVLPAEARLGDARSTSASGSASDTGSASDLGAAVVSGSGSGSQPAEIKPTPSPEELQLKQIMSEPQPLVPSLPGVPEGVPAAQAASAAAQVPVLPPPPARPLPAKPLPPPPAVR